MASFTKIAGQSDAPPQPPFTGASGLLGGSNLTLMIASGATRATLAIYNFTQSVQIIDAIAFAKLPNGIAAGWSSPRIVKVDAVTPVQIGGSGGTSPIYPVGAATSQSSPPGAFVGTKRIGPYDVAIPQPQFVPPAAIAMITGGPVYCALVDTDAAPGTSIVFSGGGS